MSDVQVRHIKKSDAKITVALIKEFCAHYNDQTKLTVKDITKNCFGKEKNISIYLAFVHKKVAGFACVRTWINIYVAKKTTHIDFLYVRKTLRRKGVGQSLLCYTAKDAIKNGAYILSIDVQLKNKVASKLYKKMGFTRHKISSHNFRLDYQHVKKMAQLEK